MEEAPKLLASPRPGPPPPPPPLFHPDVTQSDCSLVDLSAGWFSLFYTLADDAREGEREQSPQANMVSVSFVLPAARSPPAAAAAARLLC